MSRYAVVVGINRYVGFNRLNHAVNDANEVADWLVARGGVPPTQLKRILSSPGDGPLALEDARPLAHEILLAIELWREHARRGVADRTLDWKDTRLFVYVSGHGLAPTPDDAALLPADATRMRTGSVSLKEIRDFLVRSQEFHEVVLVADCCRDDIPGVPALPPPWTRVPNPNRDPVRQLFWRATAFNTKSFEAPAVVDTPEEEHGFFTRALLAGLNGEAERRGVIDAASLSEWLEREVPRILPAGRRQTPEVRPNSVVDPIVFWRADAAPARLPVPVGDVEVELRSAAGVTITVLDAAGELVAKGKVRLVTNVAPGDYTFVFRDADGERPVRRRVDAPLQVVDAQPDSIVPVVGSDGRNETHDAATESLARDAGAALGTGSGLVMVVRYRKHDPAAAPPSLDGLTFRGVPLGVDAEVSDVTGALRLVGGRVACGAGAWPLRFPGPSGRHGPSPARVLPLHLHEGWLTCVFAPPDAAGRAMLEGASVHMRRAYGGDPAEASIASEYALDAVTRGIAGLPHRELQMILLGKWENPMLGILGAHLLLLEDTVRWSHVREALTNLATIVPGNPDLAGLHGVAGRRWEEAGEPGEPQIPPHPAVVTELPILWRSWEGILWLDQKHGVIQPGSAAESRAADVTAAGPWVAVTEPSEPEFLSGVESFLGDPVVRARVLDWSRAARTRDPREVAAGTRLPMGIVRRILGG